LDKVSGILEFCPIFGFVNKFAFCAHSQISPEKVFAEQNFGWEN
jgi:hypothetical protein